MHKVRRAAAAAALAVIAVIAWPGGGRPAAAHGISCYTPGYPSEVGSYVECQVGATIHEQEHEVYNVVWIVYCEYEYLNGRYCL
jgi:hypothetical protein